MRSRLVFPDDLRERRADTPNLGDANKVHEKPHTIDVLIAGLFLASVASFFLQVVSKAVIIRGSRDAQFGFSGSSSRAKAAPSTLPRSVTRATRHPHTVRTFSPACEEPGGPFRRVSCSHWILSAQNFLLVDGSLERRQPLWPCQKHPLTKMATLNCGTIMSGVPGSRRSCRRKRILCRRRNLSTSLSGSVFDPRTRLISQLRFSFESLSAIIYGHFPPAVLARKPAARLK